MTILERIKKQKRFVEETNVIANKLFGWQSDRLQMHRLPPKEDVEREWMKFYKLFEQAKKDGIGNGYFFKEQVGTITEVFKFFEDICPEFKELK